MTPTLETNRLILRPVELADAAQMQPLFPHWEIVRYMHAISITWPYPPDGTVSFLREKLLPKIERGQAWSWTPRLKTRPDQLIGLVNVQKGAPEDENDNRGFWMGLPWQRQGLMTEACDAVTDYWFDVLKFPVLRVSKAVANTASRRISEKQCMRVVAAGHADYVAGRLPNEIWEITADEWRARRKSQP